MDVAKNWQLLEESLKEHAPQVFEELETEKPLFTKQSWDDLCELIGQPLPVELSFYFQMIPYGAEDYPSLISPDANNTGPAYGPLSIEQAIDEWQVYSDLLDEGDFDDNLADSALEVKPNWWNKKWVPIAWQGNGDLLCFDLDPDESGKVGQIVELVHDWDTRPLIAHSLADLFENVSLQLNNKIWVYDEELEGIQFHAS